MAYRKSKSSKKGDNRSLVAVSRFGAYDDAPTWRGYGYGYGYSPSYGASVKQQARPWASGYYGSYFDRAAPTQTYYAPQATYASYTDYRDYGRRATAPTATWTAAPTYQPTTMGVPRGWTVINSGVVAPVSQPGAYLPNNYRPAAQPTVVAPASATKDKQTTAPAPIPTVVGGTYQAYHSQPVRYGTYSYPATYQAQPTYSAPAYWRW
eukprot:NODE_4813_length_748_cov_38.067633_g4790_i0.p2 GENE.NODE_4813_length_748_cov_38.067633_g4790_i0~~NODE_4813_length_748_cov_38.067633_g4790_i0.p2  ORF type:complete len:208 (+),score=29.05 NODE_4813_length_748_cov_38.067633_g4790_i0:88-711(+)